MKKALYYGFVCPKLPHRERMQLAADAGLDGIEIGQVETQAETEEIAAAAADAGLEVHSVMCGTHWRLPLSSTDEAVREQGVEGVKQALHVAKWSGADTVLVVPGIVTEDISYAAAYELSKKSIREILPTAEQLGVNIALENVWSKFLLSPIEFRDFIDSFESDLVKAYFDVGNILLFGYPHQWIDILGERIVKIHVKDFNTDNRQFVSLLTGSVDYPRVMNALRGVGYNGYITAEVSAYRQFPEQFVFDTARQLHYIISSAQVQR
ncbi:sugar phosphate isomerase/epimerase [bacterium]|nr:sugar phosphate isomerase/epimerase [bacterium]